MIPDEAFGCTQFGAEDHRSHFHNIVQELLLPPQKGPKLFPKRQVRLEFSASTIRVAGLDTVSDLPL